MSSKIATVRTSIVTKLGSISGLRVSRYEVDQLQPPIAVVRFPRTIVREAFSGKWRYEVPVVLFESRASDRSADVNLETYTDAIFDLLDGDPDLDGNVESSQIVQVTGYKVTTIADTDYLAVEILVEVLA